MFGRPINGRNLLSRDSLQQDDLNTSLNFMVRADKTSGTNQVFDVYFDNFSFIFLLPFWTPRLGIFYLIYRMSEKAIIPTTILIPVIGHWVLTGSGRLTMNTAEEHC